MAYRRYIFVKHFALIGRSLKHSLSKRLFDSQRFDGADYRMHEMESLAPLREWIVREEIAGFNVTNPFKQLVVEQLDELDVDARTVGAVNCVRVDGNRLIGYNTDAPAFYTTLPPLQPDAMAFILGTGGAAKAVAHALETKHIPYVMVSRQPALHAGACSYDEARQALQRHPRSLLVNSTPVGTSPEVDSTPWPWPETLHRGMVVYDLVYNPEETLLLHHAKAHGCLTINGLDMLKRQAELSWAIWGLDGRE